MANVRSTGGAGIHDELAPHSSDDNSDERYILIDRIVSSAVFRRAGRLRDLLRYLAEVTARGQAADLTEQRIGEAVFAKPAGYSPVEDSSVRVHMRQLRLKLHEYFDSEGREEPLIVEIPKGSYALVFHPIPVPVPARDLPQAAAPKTAVSALALAPWALVIALSAICISLWFVARTPVRVSMPWPLSAVFYNTDRTQIVLADATYGIRRLLSGKPASLEEYVKRDFQRGTDAPSGSEAQDYLARYSADALLTSWADVSVATALIKLLPRRPELVSVRSARDLRFRDLKEGNYVFLGSPASNPWVLLFEDRLNFQEIRGDETRGVVKFFRNKKPRAGEQAAYVGLPRTGVDGDDYAAIALLPADTKRGTVLIIQGLQQEGTEAAGLFLSDEGGRSKLRKALGLEGEPVHPVYFEVLLRIKAVAGSPGATSIVASREVQP
jgi:hypothetical protein